MAKEYIERDALRKDIQEYVLPITTNNLMGAADSYHRIMHLLDDAPAADVVEVVRCKDCKYSRPLNRKDMFEDTFVEGCVWCMLRSGGVFEDDFCSDGEKRDNNAVD